MKRSEMVDKIAREMALNQAIAMTSGNYWDFLAKVALRVAEEQKMKPPTFTNGEKEVCYDTGAVWEKQHETWEKE